MEPKYSQWIKENYLNGGYGQCEEATQKMIEAFPELTRVRGHYYCIYWGKRAHWWCKTKDNIIIDPTVGQFPSNGDGYYEEWDETKDEPTGICMNCGDYCYEGRYFCSNRCEVITMSDMGV